MLVAILKIFIAWRLGAAVHNPTAATFATVAATPRAPADLLLAMAWIESNYTDDAVSRIEGRRRVTWPPLRSFAQTSGPYFCGPMQTSAGHSREKCAAMRGLIGYRLGAAEIETWLTFCRGDLPCALSGFGCGVAAARNRMCAQNPKNGTGYADRVGWLRARIAARAHILPVAPRFRILATGTAPHKFTRLGGALESILGISKTSLRSAGI